MNNSQKILIIEPSAIIREGIFAILSDVCPKADLSLIGSMDDLSHPGQIDQFNLILVNPVILNLTKPISKKHQDLFSGKTLIGLISTHYDRSTLNEFADNIFLTDDEETIANTIIKNLKPSNQKNAISNPTLSDREIDVLKLLASGKSNKEIAESLFISIHTVVSHRKNISSKLGVKSTAALVIYAVANNLIKLDEFS